MTTKSSMTEVRDVVAQPTQWFSLIDHGPVYEYYFSSSDSVAGHLVNARGDTAAAAQIEIAATTLVFPVEPDSLPREHHPWGSVEDLPPDVGLLRGPWRERLIQLLS